MKALSKFVENSIHFNACIFEWIRFFGRLGPLQSQCGLRSTLSNLEIPIGTCAIMPIPSRAKVVI